MRETESAVQRLPPRRIRSPSSPKSSRYKNSSMVLWKTAMAESFSTASSPASPMSWIHFSTSAAGRFFFNGLYASKSAWSQISSSGESPVPLPYSARKNPSALCTVSASRNEPFPVTVYGIPSVFKNSSISSTWRLVRHSTAISEKLRIRSSPEPICSPASSMSMPPTIRLISLAAVIPSERLPDAVSTRTGSPFPVMGTNSLFSPGFFEIMPQAAVVIQAVDL